MSFAALKAAHLRSAQHALRIRLTSCVNGM